MGRLWNAALTLSAAEWRIKMQEINEVYEMLKKAGTYYLATCDEGQPRVRPFGTVNLFNGKLYIQTGKANWSYAPWWGETG